MSFQPQYRHVKGFRSSIILSALLVFTMSSSAEAFKSSNNSEVSPTYKARRVGDLHLGAYKDELVECSALAGIHSWIGDNLDDISGAEVRRKINGDYWINTSKAYLDLAEQTSGTPDLSAEMGVQMRALAVQFRELTEAPAGTANWSKWYELIDRCDSWRVESPKQAFYSNGRHTAQQASNAEPKPAGAKKVGDVAKAPF